MTNHHHPARIALKAENGIVLVGSDLHVWPGPPSVSQRAFLKCIKDMQPKVIVLNGDVIDGATISRWPGIGWERKPDLIEEVTAAQERLAEFAQAAPKGCKLVWNLGNHDCLTPDTECLTKRGWLTWEHLRSDDLILSKVGDGCRWDTIGEIVHFPYDGDLVRIEKTRMSMAVTPNHRVLLSRLNWRSKQYDIEEYRVADDLPWSFNIPQAAHIGNPEYPGITDDEITLAGWVLTDGCFGPSDISIYQSKPDGIAQIEALLGRLGIAYSRYDRVRQARPVCGRALLKEPLPSTQFYIRAVPTRHIWSWLPSKTRLPAWAALLSGRQFAILLDAIVAGDGVWDGDPQQKTCCVIYGKRPLLDDIQALALQHGWRARIATDARNDPRLCLALEPKLRIERPEIFREHYTGTVWCLRVPAGNFMVRHNGCAYFTGNSRFETFLAKAAEQYRFIKGLHLKDHFPDWEPAWAAWINEDVVVKHRFKGGVHAPHNNVMWAGKNIITGHLHSAKITPFSDYNGTRYGVDTGCMCPPNGPQFYNYTEDSPKNHREAFACLTFHKGKLLYPELVIAVDDRNMQFRGKIFTV